MDAEEYNTLISVHNNACDIRASLDLIVKELNEMRSEIMVSINNNFEEIQEVHERLDELGETYTKRLRDRSKKNKVKSLEERISLLEEKVFGECIRKPLVRE